ncbi:MAG: hypothetical protein N2555_04470 [Endomicrobia bacterium]|nr:hypothetical protein [Endomicrobiia bacterium]
MKKITVTTFFIFISFCQITYSITKMFLDTNYKMSYIEYENLDFNISTSTDNFNKVYSVLTVSLKTFIDNTQFEIEMNSLGEAGTENYQNIISTTYSWQMYCPYPNIQFQPWLSQFYFKYKYDFVETFKIPYLKLNVDGIHTYFVAGRQRKEFVEGLVVGDNKIGYDGLSFGLSFGRFFYIDGLLSKLVSKQGFVDNRYFDLYCFLIGSKFYDEYDFGINTVIENDKMLQSEKIFYEFFIKRATEKYMYILEYIMQRGSKQNKDYSGSLWYFRGAIQGESKNFGKSMAGLVWLLSSGGSEHGRFNPTCTRSYEYMEPYGYGEFTRANARDIFFNLPDGYSGVFILGLDFSVNPLSKLYTGFEYYLYSSPEAPDDKPDASATERTLGAKKAIGLEYGISGRYEISKDVSVNFSYSIFDPTANAYPKKQHDIATKFVLSLVSKF